MDCGAPFFIVIAVIIVFLIIICSYYAQPKIVQCVMNTFSEDQRFGKLILTKQEVTDDVQKYLAEEPDVERKMARRGIVPLLISMLSRTNSELLILVLLFLMKVRTVCGARTRGWVGRRPRRCRREGWTR